LRKVWGLARTRGAEMVTAPAVDCMVMPLAPRVREAPALAESRRVPEPEKERPLTLREVSRFGSLLV